MGYAARLKHQRRAAGEQTMAGNPEPYVPRATAIAKDLFDQAVKAGQTPTVRFSDRSYSMDARGCLRRIAPTPVAGQLTYGPPATQELTHG